MSLLISGGLVVDPARELFESLDLLVEGVKSRPWNLWGPFLLRGAG